MVIRGFWKKMIAIWLLVIFVVVITVSQFPFLSLYFGVALLLFCWLMVLRGALEGQAAKKRGRVAVRRRGTVLFLAVFAAVGAALQYVGSAKILHLYAILGPVWFIVCNSLLEKACFAGLLLLGARCLLGREGLWRGLSLRESWRPAVVLVAGDAVVVFVQLMAMPPGVEMICYYAMLCALAGFTADWVARGARTKKS